MRHVWSGLACSNFSCEVGSSCDDLCMYDDRPAVFETEAQAVASVLVAMYIVVFTWFGISIRIFL